MPETTIMTEADIGRAILRIAHEILERNGHCPDLTFAGIRTRGVPLARRLASAICEIAEINVSVLAIDTARYRDDRNGNQYAEREQAIQPAFSVLGRRVVLVDDVLHTGRTVRAALNALADAGRAESIHLAVLVDRGHRELPIRANFVGKNIPTSNEGDSIAVYLTETDEHDKVVLVSRSPRSRSLAPTQSTAH